MTSIHIRGFRESDLADVAGLVTELGYASTPGEMKARLAAITARPDHATFIATRSGRVVGMIGVFVRLSYEHDTPIGHVTCFVVRAEERGHGVGKALIAAAEGWAREQGAHELTLTSHRRRKDAHAFYRHIGYAETGHRFGKPFTLPPDDRS